MRGCINSTEIDADPTDNGNDLPPNDTASSPPQIDDEVIIVRRKTQTVRAIEPRTGEERWNFSVGQHELESIRSSGDCHSSNGQNGANDILTNLDVRVVVPDGIICAVQKNAPHEILWKYKFDHPIVNVWKRDENNELKAVDLFKTVQGMWQFEGKSWTQSTDPSVINNDGDDVAKITPSIYIGMFRRQLYIQESDQLRAARGNVVDHMVGDDLTETPSFQRIPWNPIDASSSGLAQIEHETAEETSLIPTTSDEEMEQTKKNYSATAISVLYGSEYVNGNGFYLYAKTTEAICDKENTSNDNSSDEVFGINETDASDDGGRLRTPTLIKFVSLWYWWREIFLIVLSVLVFNVVLTQRRPNQTVS